MEAVEEAGFRSPTAVAAAETPLQVWEACLEEAVVAVTSISTKAASHSKRTYSKAQFASLAPSARRKPILFLRVNTTDHDSNLHLAHILKQSLRLALGIMGASAS